MGGAGWAGGTEGQGILGTKYDPKLFVVWFRQTETRKGEPYDKAKRWK